MKKILVLFTFLLSLFLLVACGDINTPIEGADIKVYTRNTESGTRGAFFELLGLNDLASSNENLVRGYIEVTSNGDMINKIKNDQYGIGYISLSGLETSGLKGLNYNGIEATEANVLDGSYTLKRPFLYIRKADDLMTDEVEKALVHAFVAFMESKDGKEIIKNNDGIVEGLEDAPTWDSIKGDHALALAQGSPITINFGGSTSVEKIATALTTEFAVLAPRFKASHSHSGSGAAFSGTRQGGTLHFGFASRDFKTSEAVPQTENGRVAWDAVVVVVNTQNLWTNITTQAAIKIYTGDTKTWNILY